MPGPDPEKLKVLLIKQRRLVLSRAPLAERLLVLRELLALDPTNAGWRHDVPAFERARLQEIASAAQKAHRVVDLGMLTSLLAELLGRSDFATLPFETQCELLLADSRGPWSVAVAGDVRRVVGRYWADVRLKDARFQLEELMPQLDEALRVGDPDRISKLEAEVRSVRQLIERLKALSGGGSGG